MMLLVVLLAPLGASATQAELRRVTIYQAPPGQSAMYAQLTPLAGQELLCAFRLSLKEGNNPWSTPGSKIVCIHSLDHGQRNLGDLGCSFPAHRARCLGRLRNLIGGV